MKTTFLLLFVLSSFVSCHSSETSVSTSDSTTKASIDTIAKVADSAKVDTLKIK